MIVYIFITVKCVCEARFFVRILVRSIFYFFFPFLSMLCEACFGGSNPGEFNFFPFILFNSYQGVQFYRRMLSCCSINFYSWDVFF